MKKQQAAILRTAIKRSLWLNTPGGGWAYLRKTLPISSKKTKWHWDIERAFRTWARKKRDERMRK